MDTPSHSPGQGLPPLIQEEVDELLNGRIIQAVIRYRRRTRTGLREARDAVYRRQETLFEEEQHKLTQALRSYSCSDPVWLPGTLATLKRASAPYRPAGLAEDGNQVIVFECRNHSCLGDPQWDAGTALAMIVGVGKGDPECISTSNLALCQPTPEFWEQDPTANDALWSYFLHALDARIKDALILEQPREWVFQALTALADDALNKPPTTLE